MFNSFHFTPITVTSITDYTYWPPYCLILEGIVWSISVHLSLILLHVNLSPYLKLYNSTRDEADIFDIRYFVKRF